MIARGKPGRRLAAFFVALAFVAPAPARAVPSDAATPPLVREILAAAGFDRDDIARVWGGEILSKSLGEGSDQELAIAVSMRLPESHREFYERMRKGQLFEIDRSVLYTEEIPAGREASSVFSKLDLGQDEVRRLRAAAPGSQFNLSTEEIARLRETKGQDGSVVIQAYREILAGRLRAYRAGGIAAVAPYAREGGRHSSPADDLRVAVSSLSGLADRCPGFYRSFAEFPHGRRSEVSHRLFWSLREIQGRPTVILSHWAMQLHQEYALVSERQFYVGQGYDALQIVIGAFSVGEGGSVIFYVNRTATDRVAGFGGSVAHALGRGVMLREVMALFREIRASATEGAE